MTILLRVAWLSLAGLVSLPGEETTLNSLGMKMVPITKGKFLMGSPEGEKGRSNDEKQVEVGISRDFKMSSTEVTQKQWFDLMGKTLEDLIDRQEGPAGRGAKLKNVASAKGKQQPMCFVSWTDAVGFCEKLTEKERVAGLIPEDAKYALPTEAEWEYACRAGKTTVFGFGDTLENSQANFYGLMPYGVEKPGVYLEKSTPVGTFAANPWGLFEMHGNLYEWCEDWYAEKLPGGVDPLVNTEGDGRIIRGGAWDRKSSSCRSAYRYSRDPVRRAHNIGFRVVLVTR